MCGNVANVLTHFASDSPGGSDMRVEMFKTLQMFLIHTASDSAGGFDMCVEMFKTSQMFLTHKAII